MNEFNEERKNSLKNWLSIYARKNYLFDQVLLEFEELKLEMTNIINSIQKKIQENSNI